MLKDSGLTRIFEGFHSLQDTGKAEQLAAATAICDWQGKTTQGQVYALKRVDGSWEISLVGPLDEVYSLSTGGMTTTAWVKIPPNTHPPIAHRRMRQLLVDLLDGEAVDINLALTIAAAERRLKPLLGQ